MDVNITIKVSGDTASVENSEGLPGSSIVSARTFTEIRGVVFAAFLFGTLRLPSGGRAPASGTFFDYFTDDRDHRNTLEKVLTPWLNAGGSAMVQSVKNAFESFSKFAYDSGFWGTNCELSDEQLRQIAISWNV